MRFWVQWRKRTFVPRVPGTMAMVDEGEREAILLALFFPAILVLFAFIESPQRNSLYSLFYLFSIFCKQITLWINLLAQKLR